MLRRILSVLIVILIVAGVVGFLVYRNGVHPKIVLAAMKLQADRTRDIDADIRADLSVAGFAVSGTGHCRLKPPSLYDLDFSSVRVVAGPDALWVVVPAVTTAVKITSDSLQSAELLHKIVSGWDAADPQGWMEQARESAADVVLWAPEVVEGRRCWVLEWPARTGERVGGCLYVSQRTRMPVQFRQKDSTGAVTNTFTVTRLRTNSGLGPEDFQYKPMAGYMTIDYEYDPDSPLSVEGLLRGGKVLEQMGGHLMQEAQRHLPPEVMDLLRGGR
jgi:outer membrane lipoprotein-sorting protein